MSGVGIDDIAATVGLTGPALYHYFPSKQALVTEVVAKLATDLVPHALNPSQPRDALGELVRVALLHRDALAVFLRQPAELEVGTRRDLIRGLRPAFELWSTAVRRRHPGASPDEIRLRGRAAAGIVIASSFTRTATSAVQQLALDLVEQILDLPLPARAPVVAPPGRSRLTPHPRSLRAFRREAIVTAAAELFRGRGFNGVSLADIGAAVNITGSAVSRQFQSKEQLLVEIFTRTGERLASSIFATIRRAPDAASAVDEIVRAYIALAIDSRDLIIINMRELHQLQPAERRNRRRNQRVYVDELASMLCLHDPTRPEEMARLQARAAFAVVNEVITDDRLIHRQGLHEDLARLAIAVARAALPVDESERDIAATTGPN